MDKVLEELSKTIEYRKNNKEEGSYTCYLFEKGLDKILKKVGEESAEVIIAAKNLSKEELVYETADLLYHLTVLLVQSGVTPDDVFQELARRR